MTNEEIDALFVKYDTNGNGAISFEEFVYACHSIISSSSLKSSRNLRNHTDKIEHGFAKAAVNRALEGSDDDEEDEVPHDIAQLPADEQQSAIKKKAFTMLGLGTLLVLLFSGMNSMQFCFVLTTTTLHKLNLVQFIVHIRRSYG